MRLFGIKTAAAAFALGLAAAPLGLAPGGPPAAWAQAEQFTEQQIQSFAAAAVQVSRISERWLPRIQDATSEAESLQLREQANAEMVEAIEGENLDLETYNQIFRTAQQDPVLAQRVEQALLARN